MPSETTTVRLLCGRTGYGRAGDVVQYPIEEAELHEARGLVAFTDEPTTTKKAPAAAARRAGKKKAPPKAPPK